MATNIGCTIVRDGCACGVTGHGVGTALVWFAGGLVGDAVGVPLGMLVKTGIAVVGHGVAMLLASKLVLCLVDAMAGLLAWRLALWTG